MIKLKSLLLESDISDIEFGNIIRSAYTSIFDIDEIEVIKAGKYSPGSHMHSYYKTVIGLQYKFKNYVIYNTLYFYKFPHKETQGMTGDEWDASLIQAERMPHVDLNKQLLTKPNHLFHFIASIYENPNKNFTQYSYFSMEQLTEIKDNNILGLVQSVKKYMDSQDSDADDTVDITPDVPHGKLTPALK